MKLHIPNRLWAYVGLAIAIAGLAAILWFTWQGGLNGWPQ